MTMTFKRWTGLGLGAAMLGGALAGCGEVTDTRPADTAQGAGVETTREADDADMATPVAVAGGEAGEGESGEGGIDVALAATDAVVFRQALAVTQAHIIAARDAYAAGEQAAAAEMFAHPVSEVLFDMEPAFGVLGVEPFDAMLLEASAAASEGAPVPEILDRSTAILARLEAVASQAPASDLPDAVITARVIADQIDRASMQYGYATGSEAYGPYLDGYGFYVTARDIYLANIVELAGADQEAAAAIEAALAALQDAFPSVLRPDAVGADVVAVMVANSSLQLLVSGL